MIAFVKEAEALLEKGQLERLKNEEGEVMNDGTSKRCVTRGGALFSRVTNEFGDFRLRTESSVSSVMSQSVAMRTTHTVRTQPRGRFTGFAALG